MRKYGHGSDYQRRVPSMYAFYSREIQEAYDKDDWERASYLISDAPKDIYQALERNGFIEQSIEASRKLVADPSKTEFWEQVTRAVIISLQDRKLLKVWPSIDEVPYIATEVRETYEPTEYSNATY